MSFFLHNTEITMKDLKDIMRHLALNGVETFIKYDFELNEFYLDLNTEAKSYLHLYEDGTLRGRYSYKPYIDLSLEMEDIIRILCLEFEQALCGRNYYQQGWGELCKVFKVNLDVNN